MELQTDTKHVSPDIVCLPTQPMQSFSESASANIYVPPSKGPQSSHRKHLQSPPQTTGGTALSTKSFCKPTCVQTNNKHHPYQHTRTETHKKSTPSDQYAGAQICSRKCMLINPSNSIHGNKQDVPFQIGSIRATVTAG